MSAPRPPSNYGPFSTEADALRSVVDRLVNALRPREIFLFGSRAEGRAEPWSDFDLAVVLDDTAPPDIATYEGVYAPLLGSGIGCDVVPYRVSELTEVLGDAGNPWHATLRRAKKLYERP